MQKSYLLKIQNELLLMKISQNASLFNNYYFHFHNKNESPTPKQFSLHEGMKNSILFARLTIEKG